MLISPISMYNTQARISFGSTNSRGYSRNFDDTIHFDPIRDDNDEGFHTRYNEQARSSRSEYTSGAKHSSQNTSAAKSSKSEQKEKPPVSRSSRRRRRAAALLLAGSLAVGGHFGATTLFPPTTAIVINVDQNQTVNDIANIYDIPVEVLTTYNNVDSTATNKSIAIPEMYDYVQDEIEEIRDKLYDEKLDQTQRNEYEAEIVKLQAKQEKQQEVATVYTDGSWVYIKANQNISAPELRELFDIKKGAMSSHNNLPFTYETDERTGEHYKDYEGAVIQEGQVIKVRERDIKFD